ncbi:MAG TPA: selenocysteine-specific translation factor, partial [Syntrophobacteraceae bacterium]|nr:selenocysteine-specific translation factor [Syntrophobacteraceae bacterium]
DRVFSMKGFGTVVTGTSTSGRLRVGDTAVIYPSIIKTKVRGLQVHNHDVEEILPGQRTAINLQSLERGLIQRGDVVSTPDAMLASYMVDVHLELLSSAPRPVKNRAKVRFHTGTAEHLATVVLLDREELKPGDHAFVQLRFDTPLAVLRGDRYVVRSYSPIRTIGGGTVLHPQPARHKGRAKAQMAQALPVLLHGLEADIILWHVERAGEVGVSEQELQIRANVFGKPFERILQPFVSQRKIILYDKENRRLLHPTVFEALQQTLLTALHDYHGRFALKAGMPKEELAAQLPQQVDNKLYNFILQHLSQVGTIAQEREWIRLATHRIDLGKDQQAIRQKIEKAFQEGGLQPPFFREVAPSLPGTAAQQQEVLQWMLSQSILV